MSQDYALVCSQFRRRIRQDIRIRNCEYLARVPGNSIVTKISRSSGEKRGEKKGYN